MGQEENKVLPMLGMKERQSKMKFAHQVEEKGPNEYAIQAIIEDIESLGIKLFIFKSDQEPAILSLKERVIETLGKKYEVIPEEPPVGDHQANGEIEKRNQRAGKANPDPEARFRTEDAACSKGRSPVDGLDPGIRRVSPQPLPSGG